MNSRSIPSISIRMRATPYCSDRSPLGATARCWRRVHRRLGHAWIDNDDLRGVRIPHDPFPHDRMGNAEVAADQHDDVRFLEVRIRVGRCVEAERLFVRNHGGGHTLPSVAVAMQQAIPNFASAPRKAISSVGI